MQETATIVIPQIRVMLQAIHVRLLMLETRGRTSGPRPEHQLAAEHPLQLPKGLQWQPAEAPARAERYQLLPEAPRIKEGQLYHRAGVPQELLPGQLHQDLPLHQAQDQLQQNHHLMKKAEGNNENLYGDSYKILIFFIKNVKFAILLLS